MTPDDSLTVADVAELFVLALSAGLTAGAALPIVAAAAGGPSGGGLRALAARAEAGEPLAEVLGELVTVLGESARSLTSALVMHVRYGLPAIDALERAAHEARLDHRLALEARARRLPVALLFPLVFCMLPAFVLLAIVPVVVTTLHSISP